MERKPISLIIIIVALAAVCGLCVMTVYGSLAWIGNSGANVRIFNFNTTSAKVTENASFDPKPNLYVQSDVGDVTITASDTNQIEIEMIKTAWGTTEAEAQAAAEAIEVTVDETEDTLKLIYDPPDELGIDIGPGGGKDSIEFIIKLPAETALDITTHFGDVALTGIHGEVKVDTSFGDVDLNDIQAGDTDIRLSTSFGDITLNDFTAAALSIDNSNGEITVTVGGITGDLELTTSFGDIEVWDVAASSYDLHTSNGKITLNGATGKLDLESSFGDIVVTDAEDAILNLETSNGTVRFDGSLDEAAEHRIETSFGDIDLTIPDDSVFDLELETSFGEITSDLPVTVSGSFSETSWSAELNGGGSLLTAKTSNGDITLSALAGE